MKSLVSFLCILCLAGCATGFHREGMEMRLADEAREYNDDAIQKAMESRPQARFPMRIAVYMTMVPYRNPDGHKTWRWTPEDKAKVAEWAEPLRKAGVVSDVFVMSDLVINSRDMRGLRIAAAKHGADALLIINGVADLDAYVNPVSTLNLLIAPGWFLPGSNRDALVIVRGALVDVANEFLYLSAEGESEVQRTGPTFRINANEVVDEAKGEALERFGQEFVNHALALKASAQ